jgi:molybdopterin converting factor small subunit
MKIKVQYFASLRDCTQKAQEVIETQAKTINELYLEVNAKYQFPIDQEYLRVAQNDCYVQNSSVLADLDVIVFIPPLSGG